VRPGLADAAFNDYGRALRKHQDQWERTRNHPALDDVNSLHQCEAYESHSDQVQVCPAKSLSV